MTNLFSHRWQLTAGTWNRSLAIRFPHTALLRGESWPGRPAAVSSARGGSRPPPRCRHQNTEPMKGHQGFPSGGALTDQDGPGGTSLVPYSSFPPPFRLEVIPQEVCHINIFSLPYVGYYPGWDRRNTLPEDKWCRLALCLLCCRPGSGGPSETDSGTVTGAVIVTALVPAFFEPPVASPESVSSAVLRASGPSTAGGGILPSPASEEGNTERVTGDRPQRTSRRCGTPYGAVALGSPPPPPPFSSPCPRLTGYRCSRPGGAFRPGNGVHADHLIN